ncbi:cysteine-rich receptor-like protein kinase 29 [Prunus yedoensis var. nudiflora]|uniref:Cysteine-rich receptor-like protein kinase 29 n=1 Tax=Prunus yedoensis var. nudiflora TaxID=2094558 RepID=A0A314ZSY9_PRUYE|nr:cysteine-rich receptor-like protein kinase 29 [Prunus yedoensis var. nudiflora]
MGSSRLLIFFIAIPIILDLVAPPAVAQIDDGVCTYTADFCWDVPILVPTMMAASTKKTSTTSSPPSHPTIHKSIMAFTIHQWDKTPTK